MLLQWSNPAEFGLPLAVLIALDAAHDKLESVLELLASWPEIQWVSATTGRFDIIALARLSSTEALSSFLKNQLSQIEWLKDSETFMYLDVRKGRYVPIT